MTNTEPLIIRDYTVTEELHQIDNGQVVVRHAEGESELVDFEPDKWILPETMIQLFGQLPTADEQSKRRTRRSFTPLTGGLTEAPEDHCTGER